MAAITTKQEIFCLEYIKDMNATQAAIRTGYSEKTAQVQGCRLLSNANIQERLATLISERAGRVKVDSDYVLERLVSIDQMDFLDILNDDMSFKPLSEWPKVWRQYISSFDLAEMFEVQEDSREMVGIMKKIKWPDKVRNLELIGKHVDVQAFNDKSTSSVSLQINRADDAKW